MPLLRDERGFENLLQRYLTTLLGFNLGTKKLSSFRRKM